MIVVIEAWVHCEIDLTYFFLQIIFLVFSLIKVGFRVKVRVRLGLYLLKTRKNKKNCLGWQRWGTISQIGITGLGVFVCMYVCVCMWVCILVRYSVF